jgi:hypothetical protein
MTTASGKQLPVGLRFACIFALSAAGYPKAVDENPYAGLEWNGPKGFKLTPGEPRKVAHVGKDRVLATDFLPTQEGMTADLNVSDYRYDIHALLTGTKEITVGEAKEIAHQTDQSGYEPQVGVHLYQQALDLSTGARVWRSVIFPKAICIPMPGGAGDTPQDVTYKIAPQVCKARLWGETLVLGTDGYTEAQAFEYMTEGVPRVVSFLGQVDVKEYNVEAGKEAKSTSKMMLFKNGVHLTTDVTLAVDGFTLTSFPLATDEFVLFYEM